MTLDQLDDYKTVLRRLVEEQETELARKLAYCVTPLWLKCEACGADHCVNAQCKRRWCPICAPKISRARFDRVDFLSQAMKWPLYVVTTHKNLDDDKADVCIRETKALNKAFRRSKWWRRSQAGGVWSIEITNIGNGWHPHTNYLVDSRWLAQRSRAPRASDTPEEWKALCEAAQKELCDEWSSYVGADSVCWVERAHGRAAREVLKYSVKSQDLVKFPKRIGPIIHAIDEGRLMQRFGASYGQTWPIKEKIERECEDCGQVGYLVHRYRAEMQRERDRDKRGGMAMDQKFYDYDQLHRVLEDASRFELRAERINERITSRREQLAYTQGT